MKNENGLTRRRLLTTVGSVLAYGFALRHAKALQAPSGATLDVVLQELFRNSMESQVEGVGFVLVETQSPFRSAAIDMSHVGVTRSGDSVDVNVAQLVISIGVMLRKVNGWAEVKLLDIHSHPISGVKSEYPKSVVAVIENSAKVYCAMPSDADMVKCQGRVLEQIIRNNLQDGVAVQPISVRDVIGTHCGVYIMEPLSEDDPRFSTYSQCTEEERERLQDEWDAVSQRWIIFVNRSLASGKTWDNILNHDEYKKVVFYAQKAYGVALAFIEKSKATPVRIIRRVV